MIINHNMNAMNAHRNMTANTAASGKAMEKLSSGLRINRAGDDAAGLAISEKMRGQIRGLDQASRNAQDGISMIQTAEGALNETHSILQRMKELSTQAASDTNTIEDRAEIQKEMNQLTSEINRIGNTTEFNTQKLLNGEKGSKTTGAVNGKTTAENAAVLSSDVTGLTGAKLEVTVESTTFELGNSDIVALKDMNETDAAAYIADKAVDTDGNKLSTVADVTFVSGKLTITAKTAATDTDVSMTVTAGTGATDDAEDLLGIGTEVKVVGDSGTTTDGSATLQIGANQDQSFKVTINDMRANALGLSGTAGTTATGATGASFAKIADTDKLTDSSMTGDEYALDVTDNKKASAAIKVIDKAIASVSSERSKLGAYQNRLEHTIANLGTASENLTSAESRVRDVDMAKEMMNFSKNNILSQAAQAMLAQANSQPQGVLQLLR